MTVDEICSIKNGNLDVLPFLIAYYFSARIPTTRRSIRKYSSLINRHQNEDTLTFCFFFNSNNSNREICVHNNNHKIFFHTYTVKVTMQKYIKINWLQDVHIIQCTD